MRIISPFHDYYDTAIGFGTDPELIYQRKPEYIDEINLSDEFPRGLTFLNHSITPIYTALAGQWFVTWRWETEYAKNKFRNTLFSGNDAVIDEINNQILPKNLKFKLGVFDTKKIKKFTNKLEHFSTNKENLNKKAEQFHVEYKTPLLVFCLGRDFIWAESNHSNTNESPIANNLVKNFARRVFYFSDNHKTDIYKDIPLNIFNIQKQVDSYTAFQNIAQYLGGVLGMDGRPMVQLNDNELRDKHGFDPKYGFRHRP